VVLPNHPIFCISRLGLVRDLLAPAASKASVAKVPPNPILSRAANDNPDVVNAKHSKWKGIRPSPTVPINQDALLEFSRKTTDPREKMSALRLLKLSRNTRCPGSIPVLYEQKSTGRLTEVLFAIQNNQREVIQSTQDPC